MAFIGPKTLQNLAAIKYVEIILEMTPLYQMKYLELLSEKAKRNGKQTLVKLNIETLLEQLKEALLIFQTVIKPDLLRCNETAIQCVQNCLKSRSPNYYLSEASSFVLQLLINKEIHVGKNTFIFFSICREINKGLFAPIEKITYKVRTMETHPFVPCLLQKIPNLRVFEGDIIHPSFLEAFPLYTPGLVHLNLHLYSKDVGENELCSLFFKFKSLKEVQNHFAKLAKLPLSFPNLKVFGLPYIQYKQYDFFKMFLHYYPKLELIIANHYYHIPPDTPVSWFDAVLSHTVSIYSMLPLKNCELTIQDVMLPFCSETIKKWKHLESIAISIRFDTDFNDRVLKPNEHTMKTIANCLKNVLMSNKNVCELSFRFCSTLKERDIDRLLYPALLACGDRIKVLKINCYEPFAIIGHKSLVNIINFCPNMTALHMFCRVDTELCFEPLVEPLTYLETFKYGWSHLSNTPRTETIDHLVADILENATNLKKLVCSVDKHLLQKICQTDFGSKLVAITFYMDLYLEEHTNWIWNWIKDKLKSLNSLKSCTMGTSRPDDARFLDTNIIRDCKHCNIHFVHTNLDNMESDVLSS